MIKNTVKTTIVNAIVNEFVVIYMVFNEFTISLFTISVF